MHAHEVWISVAAAVNPFWFYLYLFFIWSLLVAIYFSWQAVAHDAIKLDWLMITFGFFTHRRCVAHTHHIFVAFFYSIALTALAESNQITGKTSYTFRHKQTFRAHIIYTIQNDFESVFSFWRRIVVWCDSRIVTERWVLCEIVIYTAFVCIAFHIFLFD